jgi:Bacteriophage head to tail connecting protein
MTGRTLELHNVLQPDMLATRLTERWIEWDTLRNVKKIDWEEIRRYVYATDTTQTTNAQLPWKNKTTVPKLCQIRDNLFSNYTATLFPQRKWLVWEADEKDSNSVEKRDAITNYMNWAISQKRFKNEIYKIILDYIDFGNCFATVEWVDDRVQQLGKVQAGYVGPAIRRISPLDIVMNPTAEDFARSPKMIRSIISLGELREYMQRMTTDENRNAYEELYNYLKNIRFHARTFQGDWQQRDRLYSMDGFTSFRAYLLSDFVEVLTFYGDWYDMINDHFEKNRVITVVDRHRLIENRPNESYFSSAPIFHVPWRKKQENLWGMGPLDNLVGMQYRMDHVENMKADVFDLVTYPVQKVKGFVEEYTWKPGEKIFTGEEGDVEMVVPDVQALNANLEIQNLERLMEEMAGAPREAMGFRTPGEKTKYEVQRLENAAARVFQNKISQFEEEMIEPLLNAMLELAKRNMSGINSIRVFDDQFKIATFQELTVEDITGIGRIKPVAARHFAEQADLIQNLTSLTGSNLWPTVQPHFSGVRMAQVLEKIFNIDDYQIVMPFVSLSEQAEGQKFMNALEEQVHQASQTASGQGSDFDLNGPPTKPEKVPMNLQRQPPANATPAGTLGTQ